MGQTQSYNNHQLKEVGNNVGIKNITTKTTTIDQHKNKIISSSSFAPIHFRQRNNKINEQRQKILNRRNFRPSITEKQIEQRRQNRSQSLDPKAINQIRTVFGSARCSPRLNFSKNNLFNNCEKEQKELWNPEKVAAQLIGLQLQNPAQQNLLCLVGGKLKQQQTNNNIGQTPRTFRKQNIGQNCCFDLDYRIYEKRLNLIF